MNAYLFSAAMTLARIARRIEADTAAGHVGFANVVQSWDSCTNTIVLAKTAEDAQEFFQAWIPPVRDGVTATINKIIASQFIDQLFTEAGSFPLDWPGICAEAEARVQATPLDDDEQGYWANVNYLVPPDAVPSSTEELKASLPEENRDGLNWSVEKAFFFIVSALKPEALQAECTQAEFLYNDLTEKPVGDRNFDGTNVLAGASLETIEREATALVDAPNAVVAAWLWRRFAATTPFAANPVSVIPWCGVIQQ